MFVSMQVAQYIKDLLYRFECVIVPGFGAFLTQYRSARIDDKSHTFYPPCKAISFNRQLQTNDGLLANYIASAENCSYELALQRIRNFTGRISLELSEGKEVSLDLIGAFLLDSERNLQFTPSEGTNFNASSFGLDSFVSAHIERQLPVQDTEQKTVELYQEKKQSVIPYRRYAAIGLIALGISGFGGMKYYEGTVEKHNFSEWQKAKSIIDAEIQEATFVVENPLPTMELAIEKKVGRYHIVAGAFRFEENAQKRIQELSDKGFNAFIIGINRYGLHEVVYSSHSDRLEALKTLRQIRNSENRDAWLLVKEL